MNSLSLNLKSSSIGEKGAEELSSELCKLKNLRKKVVEFDLKLLERIFIKKEGK